MSSEVEVPRPRGPKGEAQGAPRVLRFAAGVAAGLLVLPLLGALGLAAMYATAMVGDAFSPSPSPSPRPWLEVRGPDLSAAGAARIVLKDDQRLLRIDCRDACDDLVETSGPPLRLEVLTAGGACVLCQNQNDGWGRRLKTWRVHGRPVKVEEGAS